MITTSDGPILRIVMHFVIWVFWPLELYVQFCNWISPTPNPWLIRQQRIEYAYWAMRQKGAPKEIARMIIGCMDNEKSIINDGLHFLETMEPVQRVTYTMHIPRITTLRATTAVEWEWKYYTIQTHPPYVVLCHTCENAKDLYLITAYIPPCKCKKIN